MIIDEDEPEKYHSIVVFLDDFSHLRKNDKEAEGDEVSDGDSNQEDEEFGPKIVPLYSETDDEADGNAEDNKDDDAAPKEEERPSMYNCGNVGVCGGF